MSWRCYFCDTYNADDDFVCINCDHTRAESDVCNAKADEEEAGRAEAARAAERSAGSRSGASRPSGGFEDIFIGGIDDTTDMRCGIEEGSGFDSLADVDLYSEDYEDEEADDEEDEEGPVPDSFVRSDGPAAASSIPYDEIPAYRSSERRRRARREPIVLSYRAEKILTGIFASLIIAGAFVLGQYISLLYFSKTEKSLTLEKICRLCSIYIGDMDLALLFCAFSGLVASVLLIIAVIICAKRGNLKLAWSVSITFSAAAIAVADTFMPFAAILAILILVFRRKIAVPAIILAVASVVAIPTLLSTAFFTPEIYVITLYSEYGDKGEVVDRVFVSEDEELPDVDVPTDEYRSFYGYYDENGMRYYDKNGKAMMNLTIEKDCELYASWRWLPNSGEVSDSGGLSDGCAFSMISPPLVRANVT